MIGDWNPFRRGQSAARERARLRHRTAGWRPRSSVSAKKADIMDMALAGKIAVIEAIEQDFEDQIQLAVVLDDDPGREFGMMRQPGHRFFFSPEEVEPVLKGEPA